MVTAIPHSSWKPSALVGPSQENSGKRAGNDTAAAWLVSNVIYRTGRKHFAKPREQKVRQSLTQKHSNFIPQLLLLKRIYTVSLVTFWHSNISVHIVMYENLTT